MMSLEHADATRERVGLSAIIPNYNHGAVIGEAVRALAAQSRPPDEIIIIDDGSTDNSTALIEELGRQYPTLRLVALDKNSGAIAALNRGIAEARGEFLYMGAADDVVLPGLFERLLPILKVHPSAAFSCCECLMHDIDTNRHALRPPVNPSEHSIYLSPAAVAGATRRAENWIISNALVARRRFILEAGGLDARLGSFADGFMFRQLAFEHGCCFIPRPGVIWRVTSKGYSRQEAANVENSLKTLSVALERMRASTAFPAWYPELFARRWRFSIGRIAAVAKPMNSAVLGQLARGLIGRSILRASARLDGVVGRGAALVWLTVEERPTSLIGLARTWLSRRLRRFRSETP
jgi:glycosyltransferase involved in cell wall biosynthesis